MREEGSTVKSQKHKNGKSRPQSPRGIMVVCYFLYFWCPYGQEVGNETGEPMNTTKNNSGQMHDKEETKKHSHLMRFVDLIFLHLPW